MARKRAAPEKKPKKEATGAAAKVAAVEKAFAKLTKQFFGPNGQLRKLPGT